MLVTFHFVLFYKKHFEIKLDKEKNFMEDLFSVFINYRFQVSFSELYGKFTQFNYIFQCPLRYTLLSNTFKGNMFLQSDGNHL
jgi:hypothetical protein